MNRERDRLIAKMKGWTVVGNACRKCQDGLICNINDPELDCFDEACPKWSTNRDDAWELWDEMKASTPILNYQIFDSNHLVNNAHSIDNQIMTISEEGNSFADVVSTAWIKWRGGMKCQ